MDRQEEVGCCDLRPHLVEAGGMQDSPVPTTAPSAPPHPARLLLCRVHKPAGEEGSRQIWAHFSREPALIFFSWAEEAEVWHGPRRARVLSSVG